MIFSLLSQLNFSFESLNYSNFKFKEQFSNYTDPRTKDIQGSIFIVVRLRLRLYIVRNSPLLNEIFSNFPPSILSPGGPYPAVVYSTHQ